MGSLLGGGRCAGLLAVDGLTAVAVGEPPTRTPAVAPLEPDPNIVQILPELRNRLKDPPEAASGSPESARFDLFVAVARLLQTATQKRPLVVILEDLHAADPPSLLLFRFVAAGAGDHPMVMLGTYRDVELSTDHPLTTTLPELLRAPGATRIRCRDWPKRMSPVSCGADPQLHAVA